MLKGIMLTKLFLYAIINFVLNPGWGNLKKGRYIPMDKKEYNILIQLPEAISPHECESLQKQLPPIVAAQFLNGKYLFVVPAKNTSLHYRELQQRFKNCSFSAAG